MNMTKINTPILAVAAFIALAPAVSFAADGIIDLSGMVKLTTCVINTPNVSTRLTPPEGINVNVFTGIGSTSTWGDQFNVTLNCSGTTAVVYMVLTDAQNDANTTDTMALTAASTASGIGIQIARVGEAALKFGPDSSATTATNRFLVHTARALASDIVTLGFKGRYVQTAAAVRPGSANGRATYTMSYQ